MKCKVYTLRKRYVIEIGSVKYTERLLEIGGGGNSGCLEWVEQELEDLRNNLDKYYPAEYKFLWIYKSNKRPTTKNLMEIWKDKDFGIFLKLGGLEISPEEKLCESNLEIDINIPYLLEDFRDNWIT